jgi:ribosomal protein S20
MALGALIVVAVLAVAAVEGTRFLKARASGDQSAQVTTSAANNPAAPTPGNSTTGATPQEQVGGANPPAASGSPSPAASQVSGAGNASAPPAIGSAAPAGLNANSPSAGNPVNPGGSSASTSKKGSKHNAPANLAAGESQNVTTPSGGGEQFNPPPAAGGGQVGQPAASAQELQELADQHDKLSARAQSANDSVESLRRQMTASGNNLRSDISTAQSRMKLYMGKFESALNSGDAEGAKKYMSMAEREVERLETFLGH